MTIQAFQMTPANRPYLFKQLEQLDPHTVWNVSAVKAGTKRSLDQNAISHAWYGQLARELPEDDALGWKCFCKLHIGVPILRAEDSEFREAYDSTIKGMTYEQKLKAMRILPVTSIMKTKQLSAYLETMQETFMQRGVMLEFPVEEAA